MEFNTSGGYKIGSTIVANPSVLIISGGVPFGSIDSLGGIIFVNPGTVVFYIEKKSS